MTPARRTATTVRKLISQNGAVVAADGEMMLRPEVDTQVVALARLRQMPIAGAFDEGSTDDPDAAQKAKNARKRARRVRR